MEGDQKNPGRRFQILALLDGRHSSPKGFQEGWTSRAICETVGIGHAATHHLLTRLRLQGLVMRTRTSKAVGFRRELGSGRALVGTIRTYPLVWEITEKGAKRLDYKGGHSRWCPFCAGGAAP